MSKELSLAVRTIILPITIVIFGYAVAAWAKPAADAGVPGGNILTANSLEFFLPLTYKEARYAPAPLCRFGVNATANIANYDIGSLRAGWYLNYQTQVSPLRPHGIEYAPVINLQQIGADDYSHSPGVAQIEAAIANNPGAAWLIGNEPDRRYFQNDLEPHIYAQAYHELYHLIKEADPTARIVAGNIVQPTEIRLQYLDMVLDSYQSYYGAPMPVDVWGIHNFILNEVNCDYDPTNCWGADVPPGMDVPHGEILEIDDGDNMELFIERIERFRQWMQDRGYGGLPVYLTEYGILMPEELGFPPSRVNAFIQATFDYLLTATDPELGNPADDYRLVQRLSWYSTTDETFNGWLFNRHTYQRTVFGDFFANYTAPIAVEIDLYPYEITATIPAAETTITLTAQIANSGNNITMSHPFLVRFYDGDPANGGVQIGEDQMASPLAGCGATAAAQVSWPDALPGEYEVFVVVDPEEWLDEPNRANNSMSQIIVVPPPE